MNWDWFKRRWYNFRQGHSLYLSFLLSFTNFLLIVYNFLVSQVGFLRLLFPSIFHFAVLGILVYVPLTTVVGHWHVKKQLPTDTTVNYKVILDRLDEIEKKLE